MSGVTRALPTVLLPPRLPQRFADLSEPPGVAYLRGELPLGAAVAIVGTRAASDEALDFTRRLAGDLARAGVVVLSGGARGIDSAAHRGALAAGGRTVIVAPAGFMCPYPPENAALFRRVLARGGGYLSLVPDDEPATRGGFFARNACLAALADVLVVVEAPFRSGSRNAAAQARRLGRPVFAVPFAPWVGRGRGCVCELRLGAHICESSRDILEMLEDLGRRPLSVRRRRRPRFTPQRGGGAVDPFPAPTELAPFAALVRNASSVEDVSRLSGRPVGEVQALLLTLELQGVLACDASGRLTWR